MSFGERFLTLPDLFPARQAGERWGGEQVALDLPGGPYRLLQLAAGQAEALAERFRGYLADGPPEPRDVEVRLFRAASGDFRPIDFAGWVHTFDLDYGARSVRVAGRRFMARLDLEPRLRLGVWTSLEEPVRWCELAENLLRLAMAYRLLETGGVLLHSAGVADDGGAAVFFGRSGAGKTTIARLSRARGRRVLSDDLNAVVRQGGAIGVQRLPFAGDLGLEAPDPQPPAPLRALCRLEQAAATSARRLPGGEAVASLLACAPFLNRDPHRLDRLTAVLADLAAAVPPQVLAFNLDEDFWPALALEDGA